MNPMAIMKIINAKTKFNASHPKFGAFLNAAFAGGIQQGTIIEMKVTKPDGTEMTTNLQIKQSDLELLQELREAVK